MGAHRQFSQWVHGNIKPTRKGVYMRRDFWIKRTFYSYWDGIHWWKNASTVQGALNCRLKRVMIDDNQKSTWRGLASKP